MKDEETFDFGGWFATTPDAILVVDRHFQIQRYNKAAEHFFEASSQDLKKQLCSEVLKCRTANGTVLCGTAHCPLSRVLNTQTALPNEELVVGKMLASGSPVSASVNALLTEDETFVVFALRDMSRQKEAEKANSQFVSTISHELRAPLYSVNGFISLLMQGEVGELAQQQKTYLGYAQEGIKQLSSLVEDILFIARSDAGQFEIKREKARLYTLIRQVLITFQPQARKAGITLHSEIRSTLPPLHVDPHRLIQVLNNLVTNAIKFTDPGGKVVVSAHQYNEEFVLISVADTGYGIVPEDHQQVFERFYQSNHPQQAKVGGYGLGLSIARVIVEQHGGFIDFETIFNQGTTFFFTMPLSKL
jgi:signal transduction histidine kinase